MTIWLYIWLLSNDMNWSVHHLFVDCLYIFCCRPSHLKFGFRTQGIFQACNRRRTITSLGKHILRTCHPTLHNLHTCNSQACILLLHSHLQWQAHTIWVLSWVVMLELGLPHLLLGHKWGLISNLNQAISTGQQTSESRCQIQPCASKGFKWLQKFSFLCEMYYYTFLSSFP